MFNLKALSIALGLTLSTVALNTAKAQANLNELANYAQFKMLYLRQPINKKLLMQLPAQVKLNLGGSTARSLSLPQESKLRLISTLKMNKLF